MTIQSEGLITPIDLVMATAKRIKEITKNYRYPESDGDHKKRAPRVWTQFLPEKQLDDMPDLADPPYVLVALGGGTVSAQGTSDCAIGILIAAYDDHWTVELDDMVANDRQGWMIPTEMTWRILNELAQHPTMGTFRLQYPITWELPTQEMPSPHWFGVINLRFENIITEPNYDLGRLDFMSQR